jgi:hypothetical protein
MVTNDNGFVLFVVNIADFQIETSSNPAHIMHARAFNSMKAWCPTLDDKERWLMVKIKLSLI